jgi:uncharacterized RmlC-like cupin family protein
MNAPGSAAANLLDGKVRVWSLPLFQGPPLAGAPSQKRLALAQGELAQIYDGDPGMRYVAYIQLLPERPRGNHYHDRKQEWIYVILGELSLVVEDVVSKARAAFDLRTGNLAYIPTGIAHALLALNPGQAIEFSPGRFDPDDVHPYRLV